MFFAEYIPFNFVYLNSPARIFLCSRGTMPDRVNRSAIRLPLIFWSRGESHPIDGLRFTSISHA
jgi:hypothetical protein